MTTFIESFDSLCLGRNAPAILHVERNDADETIQVSFHNFTSLKNDSNRTNENTRAELREKDSEFSLFLFQFPDSEVPDWWKDSKLIWSTEQQNEIEQTQKNWKKLFEILDSGDVTSDDVWEALTNLEKKLK